MFLIGSRHDRRPVDLGFWYAVAGCVAVMSSLGAALACVTALRAFDVGCATADGSSGACPDGVALAIPVLLSGGVATLVVLGATALMLARRAESDSIRRACVHLLWLVVALTGLPPWHGQPSSRRAGTRTA